MYCSGCDTTWAGRHAYNGHVTACRKRTRATTSSSALQIGSDDSVRRLCDLPSDIDLRTDSGAAGVATGGGELGAGAQAGDDGDSPAEEGAGCGLPLDLLDVASPSAADAAPGAGGASIDDLDDLAYLLDPDSFTSAPAAAATVQVVGVADAHHDDDSSDDANSEAGLFDADARRSERRHHLPAMTDAAAAALDSAARERLERERRHAWQSAMDTAQSNRLSMLLAAWATGAARPPSNAHYDALMALLKRESLAGNLTPANVARLLPMRRALEVVDALSNESVRGGRWPLGDPVAVPVTIRVGLEAPVTVTHFAFPLRSLLMSMLTDDMLKGTPFHWDPSQRTKEGAAAAAERGHDVVGELWDSPNMRTIMTGEYDYAKATRAYKSLRRVARREGRHLRPLCLAIIGNQDDSDVGSMNRLSAAPLHMTLGNFHSSVAGRTQTGFTLGHIERLQVSKSTPTGAPLRQVAAQVFQNAVGALLCDQLRDWDDNGPCIVDGEDLRVCPIGAPYPPGEMRWLVEPSLVLWPGDHEGRCEMACCSDRACIDCIKNYDGTRLLDIGVRSPPRLFAPLVAGLRRVAQFIATPPAGRTQTQTTQFRATAVQLQAGGYRICKPAYLRLPPGRGCLRLPRGFLSALPPDVMHAILLGLAKYVLRWSLVLVSDRGAGRADGAARIAAWDARVGSHAPFSDGSTTRNGYPRGMSTLKQPTAADVASIVPVASLALGGAGDSAIIADEAVRADVARSLEAAHNIMCMLRWDFYSFRDLEDLHNFILNFKRLVAKTFAGYSGSDFDFPKWHSIEHICDAILGWGRSRNFDVHFFEMLHSLLVKAPFRSTNFRDYVAQMMRRLRRVRFLKSALPALLGEDAAVSAALRPGRPAALFLRGRCTWDARGGVAADVVAQLPAAWAACMHERHGAAFEASAHAWRDDAAVRYRGLCIRRPEVGVDTVVIDERGFAVLTLDRDGCINPEANPRSAPCVQPQCFFYYDDAHAARAASPALEALDDTELPEDDAETPQLCAATTSARTADRNLCFAAVYAFKSTVAGTPLAAVLPHVHHAPRVLDTTRLIVVPVATLYRPVRTYFLWEPPPAAAGAGPSAAVQAAAPAIAPRLPLPRTIDGGRSGVGAAFLRAYGVALSTTLQ